MCLRHLLQLELLRLCWLPDGALQLLLPPVDLLRLDRDLLAPLDHLMDHTLMTSTRCQVLVTLICMFSSLILCFVFAAWSSYASSASAFCGKMFVSSQVI